MMFSIEMQNIPIRALWKPPSWATVDRNFQKKIDFVLFSLASILSRNSDEKVIGESKDWYLRQMVTLSDINNIS